MKPLLLHLVLVLAEEVVEVIAEEWVMVDDLGTADPVHTTETVTTVTTTLEEVVAVVRYATDMADKCVGEVCFFRLKFTFFFILIQLN